MRDAFWSPLYDLYATSEDGKPSKSVTLHYRVNLQQNTGEDWNNAKLILSTSATDMLDAGVPASNTLTIQPKNTPRFVPPPPPVATCQTAQRSTSDHDSDDILPFYCYGFSTPLPALAQTAAIISKNPMAVKYIVDEYTTIHSNDLSHKVLVAIIPFEATISHIASPRKSPVAYLQVGTHLSVPLSVKHKTFLSSAPSGIRAITICFLAP